MNLSIFKYLGTEVLEIGGKWLEQTGKYFFGAADFRQATVGMP